MVMDTMGERVFYDSGAAAEDGEAESPMIMMSSLVGKKVAMVITPEMEIKKIDGLDEILKGGEEQGLEGELRDDVKKEHVKQLSGLGYPAMMPRRAVKEGDQWPYLEKMTTAMLDDVEMKGTSSLREVGLVDGRLQAVVEVTAKGKSIVKEEDGAADDQAMPGVGGLIKKMDMMGEIVIDIEAG